MDPREAPKVTAPGMLDAFKDGFTEGRKVATGEVVLSFYVKYRFNGTLMREKVYADVAEMNEDMLTFLAFGDGVKVTIRVGVAGEDLDSTPQLSG